MAEKKQNYKEPKGYFSPAMRKAVKEFDKKQAQAEKAQSSKKK